MKYKEKVELIFDRSSTLNCPAVDHEFRHKKIALNVEKPYKLQWARYTFVNTKNDQKKIKGEITIYILAILGPVQTPLHSRAEPIS